MGILILEVLNWISWGTILIYRLHTKTFPSMDLFLNCEKKVGWHIFHTQKKIYHPHKNQHEDWTSCWHFVTNEND
jgi:hypothetical protein